MQRSHSIFEESISSSSEVLAYRPVSKLWNSQCEQFIKGMWIGLMHAAPQGPVDIRFEMRQIEQRLPACSSSIVKFKELGFIFNNHRVQFQSVPLSIPDFQMAQREICDEALCILWRGSLRQELESGFNIPLMELPQIDADAQTIREFLNNSQNDLELAKHIKLAECEMFTLPHEIAQLNQLQTLDVSHNQLNEIPNFAYSNLTWLDLRNNQLTKVSDFNLPNLKWLRLSNNMLEQIPNFNNLSNLKTLELDFNRLKQIPSFDKLRSLHNQTMLV